MKILLSLLLILTISLQAQASGYAHNMFVAHKKLQTQKDTPKPTDKYPTEHTTVVKKHNFRQPTQAHLSVADQWSDKMAGFGTLNQRFLHESRFSFFESEEEESESASKTIISALIDGVKRMVLAIFSFRG